MNIDIFNQQLQLMYKRLDALYQGVGPSAKLQPELLPLAFKELGTASEELQVAVEELTSQNEQLLTAQMELEAERQRYQNLFEFALDGYLLTDEVGKIKEANRAVANLLNVSQQFLVGKPLIVFIAEAERRSFDRQLNWMQQVQRQEVIISLLPRNQAPLKVALRLAVISCIEGKVELHISLRPTITQPTEISLNNRLEPSLEQKHTYLKGEVIPLKPKTIWQVCHGVVKLTTMSEKGEEVLVGLASDGMIFGSDLTALKIYQAVALVEVTLGCFPAIEIANSHFDQTILPKINQRLQQTELLLAISGQRHVKDRFNGLLKLLKQEIGQPVLEGTRLSIRFTHQDFADACSTTRVTITRLLGKLQTQGQIILDAKNHIIFLRE